MGADPLAMTALGLCCIAWLITATLLTLDLLGRLPFARRRHIRAFRLQATAGLAMMTVVVISQVAALAHWLPLRLTLDAIIMLAGLAYIACAIIAASIQSIANRAQRAARRGPS